MFQKGEIIVYNKAEEKKTGLIINIIKSSSEDKIWVVNFREKAAENFFEIKKTFLKEGNLKKKAFLILEEIDCILGKNILKKVALIKEEILEHVIWKMKKMF